MRNYRISAEVDQEAVIDVIANTIENGIDHAAIRRDLRAEFGQSIDPKPSDIRWAVEEVARRLAERIAKPAK